MTTALIILSILVYLLLGFGLGAAAALLVAGVGSKGADRLTANQKRGLPALVLLFTIAWPLIFALVFLGGLARVVTGAGRTRADRKPDGGRR